MLFVGGGVYGMYKTFADNRDMVTALDVDFAAGRAAATVWRPLRALRIEDSLDRFTGWDYRVKLAGRSQRRIVSSRLSGRLTQPTVGFPRLTCRKIPEPRPGTTGLVL